MRHILFALTLITPFAQAVDRVDLSIGNIIRPVASDEPINNISRIGLSWDTHYAETYNGKTHRSLRIESSFGLNDTTLGTVKDTLVAPVLHYQFNSKAYQPFLEISMGVVHLSERKWTPRYDLMSNWLFADRIGAGYTFKKCELSISFLHFSNAGLKPPNPGADMLLLRTSIKL